MCQYPLATIQGAVNREKFVQSVMKGSLQVFMDTSTQARANCQMYSKNSNENYPAANIEGNAYICSVQV